MQMKMPDCLSPFRTDIGDKAPTVGMILTDLLRGATKRAPHLRVIGSIKIDLPHRPDVHSRDDQHMLGRDRVDIAE